jgi:hypothetical protein
MLLESALNRAMKTLVLEAMLGGQNDDGRKIPGLHVVCDDDNDRGKEQQSLHICSLRAMYDEIIKVLCVITLSWQPREFYLDVALSGTWTQRKAQSSASSCHSFSQLKVAT